MKSIKTSPSRRVASIAGLQGPEGVGTAIAGRGGEGREVSFEDSFGFFSSDVRGCNLSAPHGSAYNPPVLPVATDESARRGSRDIALRSIGE